MLRWMGRWIDRLFAVLGAILFSQAPLYMHQYTQQMAGHVAELRWQYQAMEQAAWQTQKTLPLYIEKFTKSLDTDIVQQGKIMSSTIERYASFQEALTKLTGASAFGKPFIFLQYINPEVAKNTLTIFEPGFPFTEEGLAYALLGMILGYGVFYGIGKMASGVFLLFKRQPRQPVV